ncbi:GHKL domain-containing protein [Marivirga sp. S37H4]|uniref:histidine kinase n=1 Tax=Marivirga aurantiaca TaxID=2802615 RepID=A0A934X0F0_9BACT|nr:ATP-binding protein [Marivirga aurantiaca]MBK6266618.1 GHKL domain-containing protein [Marivirga aurantiaca]
MNKQLRSILIILAIIIVPLFIYGYLQLLSLNEDEQMANVIYEKQMETVLFSLNQYADDMMTQWARELDNSGSDIFENASRLVLSNEPIQLLSINNLEAEVDSVFYGDYVDESLDARPFIEQWLFKNDTTLSRLTRYLNAGFQKIQAVENWESIKGLRDNQMGITFMQYDNDSTLYNVFILLEPEFWVEQVLGAKMQEIATDNFSVAVLYETENTDPRIIYSTGDFRLPKEYTQSSLWILPDIHLAIQTTGESYSALIRERSRNNLFFLIFTLLTVLVGIFIIIRNIRSALKMAQLKSDFVSNVSHEIRTPLALIRMYAETLMLGRIPSPEKQQHYYNVIFHESGRLTYLVNNILDFSRIESNKKTYQFEEIDLNALVVNFCKSYSYTFNEKNVSCQLNLAEGELPVLADSQSLEEAFSNIVENAIKYNDKTVQLEMETKSDGKKAFFSIKDNGIGIPKSEQAKIFDKFYRLESAMTQKTKGTGLGLSLVRHIMDSHKGEIKIQSTVGVGSTFILIFPLNQSA